MMMMTMMLFPDTLHAIHDSGAVVGRSFAFAFKGQTNQSCLKINDSIIVSSTFYKLQVENIKFITNFERCNASWAWAVRSHPENALEESCHLSSICENVCVCAILYFFHFSCLLVIHLSNQACKQSSIQPGFFPFFFGIYLPATAGYRLSDAMYLVLVVLQLLRHSDLQHSNNTPGRESIFWILALGL